MKLFVMQSLLFHFVVSKYLKIQSRFFSLVKCISFWLLKENQSTETDHIGPLLIFPQGVLIYDCSDQQEGKYIIDIS